VKLRDLLRKINDSIRPMHVEGQSGSDPLLDGRVAGRAHTGQAPATSPANSKGWAFSHQDEEANHS
jgi:hypothetical protein